MLTYQGDTDADLHEIRANYRSSKRLKTPAHSDKARLIYKKMCANIALDYYNDENDTRFELLEDETLDSYSFADFSGSWIHCSFNAKEDSSINEFFAELQYVYPLGPAVTTCEILVEGETQVGCENCKSVTHPVGYRGGFPGNIGHASNAMSDDDEKDSPANHKHNETLDYYDDENDADHFVLKEPTYFPRTPRTHDEKTFCDYALDHYNKTNGTKFAYVDDGSTEWKSFSWNWIHICFSASDASASDASDVKLFFAEMKYDDRKEPIVTICKILEGETKGGCELCILKCIIHPVVGYHVELEIDPKDRDSSYNSPANHKHNETLDYYDDENDATVAIDHFVLKEPTYQPRPPTLYEEKSFCDYALDHYNKINGTKFAYVDDGSTEWTSFSWDLIHICFSASDASASDASDVKLFFAEMIYKDIVTVCKILEGETKGGCELCMYKFITHPVVGYHVELEIDPKDRDSSYKETELFGR